MNTVGLFLQPLPIRASRRSRLGADLATAPLRDFLLAVQDSARSALSHGLERSSLMKLLSLSEDETLRSAATQVKSPNHPLFEAMVTFHELDVTSQILTLLDRTIPGVKPLITWADGAKFSIMFEFSALSPSVATLRIEHDTSVFSRQQILTMFARIDFGLDYLGNDIMSSSVTIEDFENALVGVNTAEAALERLEDIEFGTRIGDLIH